MIQQRELSLGASLIAESVEDTGTASLGFWYGHGSRDERPGEHGCSHLLEHMVFKGTGTRSAAKIAREIDRVGGVINAFTEREMTCLYCSVPGTAVAIAAEVLADLATAAALDIDELCKEREVVINEIQSVEDSPEERAFQAYVERLWGSHSLSRRISGEAHEVATIEHEQLSRFYREWLNPSRLTVSVAGNVNVEEVVTVIEEALERSAGRWVDEGVSAPELRCEPVHHSGTWHVHDSCQQIYLYGGRPMPIAHTVRNYYALTLLSTIVGESMSSRLFQNLREKHGLCYSIGSFRMHLSDTWLWSIFANCMPKSKEEFSDMMLAELKAVQHRPPSTQEIEEAVSHLRGGLVFAREEMDARMRRMFYQRQTFGRVLTFDEMDDNIADVDGDVLQGLAGLVADTDAYALVAYGGDGPDFRTTPRAYS